MRRKGKAMPQSEPLVVWMVRQGGMWKALKAAGYIAAFGIAAQELGHDPSWAEYEEYWHTSFSSHARESKAFKAIFGELTPGEVWHRLSAQVGTEDLDQVQAAVLAAQWSA